MESVLAHSEFIIFTDQKSLMQLTEQWLHTHWQQKVFTELLGLQYKVVYKKGPENRVADALSRKSAHSAQCAAISSCVPKWIHDVIEGYQQDPNAQSLFPNCPLMLRQCLTFPWRKVCWGINLESGLAIILTSNWSWCKLVMQVFLGVILEPLLLIEGWSNYFPGRVWSPWYYNLCNLALYANKLNLIAPSCLVSCNHFLFHQRHGRLFR